MTSESRAQLRVVHLVAPAPSGGLETVVRSLLRSAPQAGVNAHLIVLDQLAGAHPFVEAARRDGLVPLTIPSGGRRYVAEARSVAAHLVSLQADILHTHGYHADVVGYLAARRSHCPIVSTAHGVTGGDLKNRLFEWLQHLAFRRFDRVIAVSADLGDRLASAGLKPGRLVVIRNAFAPEPGLDRAAARARLGIPDGDFRLGWVGRVSAEKGPDILLDAFAQVAALPISLSIVGDGPERLALQQRATSTGEAGRVTWHGMQPAAAACLSAFDALVLSSRTEGTPMVLLEAMAARVPVIATQVGGIPDVVSPGEALLVPPLRPDALAAAFRDVFANRSAAAVRANAAHTRLGEAFAAGPWMARHLELYRDVLDDRERRARSKRGS